MRAKQFIKENKKAAINFTADDIKELEGIRDLQTLKDRAFALISKPSQRPMKPEKVQWFKGALERLSNPTAVIKLMYDLLLSGEGYGVIGSRYSTNPNSYRQRFNEGLGDGDEANAVVAEVIKLIGEGHTEVSPDVITTKVSAALGRPFMLKDLVAANNASPELQHYISSINPTKIKFSTDILTVKNEDPMKEKQAAQDGVAKMAAKAAGRPRLGESDQGISKSAETKFHKKLDTLVHDTFGKRKDELEESAEELSVGDDVIITGPVEHQGETGVIDSFGQDNRFVVVNLYNHGKKSFHSSDVSYNDYAGSDAEEAEMYDRDPEFRDWAAKQEVDEGWGAEPAAARHREQMTATAKVLQKYKNDPVKSKIANYLFVNNWNAQSIEKELANPNAQQKFQANIDKYEQQVGPVKDWSDSMAADYLQGDQGLEEMRRLAGLADESRGHKIVANKLKDIERKPSIPAGNDAARAEQAKADYAKYVAKMKKKDPNFTPLYKMDE